MTSISSCLGLTSDVSKVSKPVTFEALLADINNAKALGLDFVPLGVTSNVILPPTMQAWVCFYQADQVNITANDDYTVILEVEAGKDWPTLVEECAAQGLWGIENLAAIPGTVGAAPIQNIGAYGVELADVFVSCQAVNSKTLEVAEFAKADCAFAYRDSYFKQTPDPWVITKVRLALSKKGKAKLEYGPLKSHIKDNATPTEIVKQITELRWSKLPNPNTIPNTGSFFHNPVVTTSKYEQLKLTFPDLVAYPLANGSYKLAAGWLIDQAGLKGKAGDGGVCMHQSQALVLTNPQKASKDLVLAHARYVQDVVLQRYGVTLQIEPIQL
ncbi:UDP-N-acetylmuramate dehydrogenase [Salinibius halmophilus]|uniref:UDP-N-acetylmuramate dehydrogenase n=1 Tax=Salinibius halmophilus TaxID=1853216 RepID=UPI000E66FEB1|nr:UDP-N-acetylmuramate dehydrogenase [Salinibius halmophilus]